MASFASRTKLDWEVDPESLVTHASHMAKLALDQLASQGIEDGSGLPLFQLKPRSHPPLKTLAPDASKLLLSDSISPLPFHKTLVRLETLEENKEPRLMAHEQLAVAKSLGVNPGSDPNGA